MQVTHEFKPCFDQNSKILILGSIPSVASRQIGFYYGHKQNRFWKVLSAIYEEQIGETKEEKMSFLKKHHLALWDVLASCSIEGSSDISIRNPIANDIAFIIKNSQIQFIYTTGKKAHELYQKYCYPNTKKEDICLPSTSPANCTYSIDQLIQAYAQLRG